MNLRFFGGLSAEETAEVLKVSPDTVLRDRRLAKLWLRGSSAGQSMTDSERWHQIEQIFEAALKREPGDRASFLKEACGNDEALRQEVESLLAQETQAEAFIEVPALGVAAKELAEKRDLSTVEQQQISSDRTISPQETAGRGLVDKTISHYRMLEKLGEGGMGVVYKAEDTRLRRLVALKFLRTQLLESEEHQARFLREAQAAAGLDHPNICTVHEIGEADGQTFLAMAYIEGATVRDKVKERPLKLEEALDIAIQAGEGLQAAHEKGIAHRDIKSANLMVTREGRVKVMDFGLAQLADQTRLTKTDTILGTPACMSPEQAQRQPTDRRTDIWSLGVVIYEMVTGRLPFEGKNTQAVLYSIVHEAHEPITGIRAGVPLELDRIVGKALTKNPAERYQHIDEMLVDLRALRKGPLMSMTTLPARSRDRSPIETAASVAPPLFGESPAASALTATAALPRRLLKWLVPIVGLLVAAGVLAWHLDRSDYWWRNPLGNAQLTPLTDFPGAEGDAAISRDGKFVVFLSDRDGPSDAWAGQIGTGEFQNLTKGRAPELGNPRVRNLGFSPDGSQVSVEVRVMGRSYSWAVPTMGGSVRPYLDGVELAWSPDGTRIAYHTDAPGDPIFVTGPNEKIGRQIYAAERGVHCHYLVWSPEGAFIYFVRGFPPDEMDIWRIRPTGGTAEQITFHNSRVAYPTLLNERTLLYIARADDGTGPWLYGMDVERRVPHRISFGVERYTSVAASADGQRLVATIANPDASLWRVPISDRVIEESGASRVALPTVRGLSPRIGPGYMLYVSSKGGNDGIWKLADKTAVELWSGSLGRILEGAAISPDGRRIAFTAQKSGRNRLYVMNASGTSVTELADSLNVRGAPAWPPVGEWITVAADQGKGAGLFKIPLDGGPPIHLVEEQVMNPVWSPDGRFLVYSGVEVGTTFPVKAVTADGKPHGLPELILSRGANRFSFLPGRPVLVVLKGDVWHKNFWLIDLVTGQQRQLTNFSREFLIGDFDLSPDGREIVFGRLKENSNVILIDLPGR